MAYATNRDLKDVFPDIDSFDTKTSLYGWVVHSGSRYKAENCGLVTQLFVSGENLGTAQSDSSSVTTNGQWYYTDDVDSMLDSMLPREQFKDQDGNYDYIIVRTTSLLACSFLIRASDPTSEIADALWGEADKNIASLNEGNTKLDSGHKRFICRSI